MPIRFPCSSCHQMLGIGTRKIGSQIKCPNCQQQLIVPDEDAAKQLRYEQRILNRAHDASQDTPPEIAIPRDQQEHFESHEMLLFLNALEPVKSRNDSRQQAAKAPVQASNATSKQQQQSTPSFPLLSKPEVPVIDAGIDLLEVVPRQPTATPTTIPLPTNIETVVIPQTKPTVPRPPEIPAAIPAASTLTTAQVPSTKQVPQLPADAPADGIWISRRLLFVQLLILLFISLLTFFVGWISGGSGQQAIQQTVGTPGPVQLDTRVSLRTTGDSSVPDAGAVILVWPKQRKPSEPLSSKGLAPFDNPLPLDAATWKSLDFIGAAYGRANVKGEIRNLILPQSGEYFVLILSRGSKRSAKDEIKPAVLQQLGDLFGAETLALLGNQRFVLKQLTLVETRVLEHTFEPNAK